ncbi:MAG TPA: molybdenum ABC transporter ATP-binding protein [Polyangiaceae bacterium]|jgi:molybdate transport system ATP-binding protein|nr:molybdenum ABC transporter ATP-binding protein [Polyangiaceae bacterium]
MSTDPSAAGDPARRSGIEARFCLEYSGFSLDVDLELPGRGVTALFGPSGSGKTTLLRCIAGLTRATGRLRVGGVPWQDDDAAIALPTHRRPLGVVFQEASLFAHLSVRKNLEFGWKRSGRALQQKEFDAIIDRLDIRPLLGRMPANLSGGERQRVAIGRALVVQPELLLMDEPLSSLDTRRKLEIFPYLERLRDELDVPVVLVSHSLDEVARLAEHLVAMDAGRVVASGPLASMLSRLDLPMADLDDAGAVIEAAVAEQDARYQLTRIDFPGGQLWVGEMQRPLGAKVRLRVQARDVSVARERLPVTSILNVLPATVVGVRDSGADRVNVQLELGGAKTVILARITRRSRDALGLAPGVAVFAQVKGVALLP